MRTGIPSFGENPHGVGLEPRNEQSTHISEGFSDKLWTTTIIGTAWSAVAPPRKNSRYFKPAALPQPLPSAA
jgi:hypothetical protein